MVKSIVLASHQPKKDPRVLWHIEFLASLGPVDVLYIPNPELENANVTSSWEYKENVQFIECDISNAKERLRSKMFRAIENPFIGLHYFCMLPFWGALQLHKILVKFFGEKYVKLTVRKRSISREALKKYREKLKSFFIVIIKSFLLEFFIGQLCF